jgi:hypothetical protein
MQRTLVVFRPERAGSMVEMSAFSPKLLHVKSPLRQIDSKDAGKQAEISAAG